MKQIKPKFRKKVWNKDNCFICLESIDRKLKKEETVLLLNFLDFLKLTKDFEYEWLRQCGKCEIILKRFLSLDNFRALEKVRFELDYLLEIMIAKLKSNVSPVKKEHSDLRKLVSLKCEANIQYPKPQVILTKISLTNPNKRVKSQEEADDSDDDCSDYDEGKCIETMSSSQKPRYTKHSNDTFTCGICKRVYTSLNGFHKHHKTTHQKLQYGCYKCPKVFTRKPNVKVHFECHHLHKQKFECEFCHRTFAYFNTLKNHRNTAHVKSKMNCDTCDRSFLDYSALWHHRKRCRNGLPPIRNPRVDNDLEMRLTCKLCKKEFFSKHRLKEHFRTIHLKIAFDCDHCEKKFTTETSRDNHVKAIHLKTRLCCEFEGCDKSFSFRTSLQRHMTSFHGVTGPSRVKIVRERPLHECEICHKFFTTNGELFNHMRVHSDKREFECKECGQFFKSQQNLKRHQRIHSGIKAIACPLTGCEERFLHYYLMKLHLRHCKFIQSGNEENAHK